MKFSELRAIAIQADKDDLEDWNSQFGHFGRAAGIEERLAFVEHRRYRLAGIVMGILSELEKRESVPQQPSAPSRTDPD